MSPSRARKGPLVVSKNVSGIVSVISADTSRVQQLMKGWHALVTDVSRWTMHTSDIEHRPDAIACLRMLVTLHKLEFCKHYYNDDIYIIDENDSENYDVGGILLRVWT